jgi:hypothetical protein
MLIIIQHWQAKTNIDAEPIAKIKPLVEAGVKNIY